MRTPYRIFGVLMLAALFLGACQPLPMQEMDNASEEAAQLSEETISAIGDIVEARMAADQIPGFALAIVKDGETVYRQGFGVMDMDSEQPVTPETVFLLASTSKPITAIAVMQLVEAGKMALDAPVTDYLPYFEMADERYQDITIEHVLTHRSGIPEGGGFLGEAVEPEFDDGAAERYVRSMADMEMLFAPDEDWAYSDMGYNLLGDVIAKVSGQSFEEYTRQHIFEPLGMEQTTFLLSEVPTTALAQPHMMDASGQMGVADVMPYSRPFAPSDTLLSSIADMSRLAQASFNHGELDGERILSEESWQQMWTVQTPTWFGDFMDNVAPDYAYGWYWGDVTGHPIVHHVGAEAGYQNMFMLAPEDDLAVIAMGNGLGPEDDFFYAVGVAQDVMKVLLGTETEETSAADLPIPRLEPTECKYPVPDGEAIECGSLIVPEDRTDPDSPMIRLHVVNFRSLSDSPKPDPIFVVHGGPGAPGALFNLWFTSEPFGPTFRAERDVIYLEHRGTNFSEPAFYCPELEADVAEMVQMSFSEEIEHSAAAVQACAERTRQENHNLSAYNALAIAADLADLRTALGYDEVNVFGISYGTVVSMLWMDHYPGGIRSVILDSVAPPNVNWLEMQLAVVDGALNTLFEACATDPACDTAYPDLHTAFSTVLSELREAPVTVAVEDGTGTSYEIEIDDQMFVSYVREGMFFGDGFTSMPAGIYAAYAGDFGPVGAARLGFLQDRYSQTGPGTWGMAKGAYYTNMCTLFGSFTDMAQALAIYDSVESDPSVHDWAVTYILTDTLALCDDRQVQPPEPNVWSQPIESESPVLMLSGTFDSDSPPLLSEAYRDAFANGYYYELPFGHVSMMSPCGLDLMAQFLADPTQEPDASCIEAMSAAWVLPE